MKRYLLDSNVWIQFMRSNPRIVSDLAVGNRFTATPAEQICVCAIVRSELMHGARKFEVPEQRKSKIERLLERFISLPFDDRAADVYGRIRDELEREGNVIGPFDMQIAAIALVHDLTLVTSNVSEFRRVKNLRVEDWSVVVHG